MNFSVFVPHEIMQLSLRQLQFNQIIYMRSVKIVSKMSQRFISYFEFMSFDARLALSVVLLK